MENLYTVLGISEGASLPVIEAAHRFLRKQLDQANFQSGTLGFNQATKCLIAIDRAYRTLINPESFAQYQQEWKRTLKAEAQSEIHPKIGQLCVAAGLISLGDLNNALERQTTINLPIGQILQEKSLISKAELDTLLLRQQTIKLPVDIPHALGKRLKALEIVSEDMVLIALIEQRAFNKKFEEALVGHGWLDAMVLHVLREQANVFAKQALA